MQLLVRYDVPDIARWKGSHDRHSGERMDAGMRQLQLWREGEARVWALYEIDERGPAQTHLDTYGALEGDLAETHWLETY